MHTLLVEYCGMEVPCRVALFSLSLLTLNGKGGGFVLRFFLSHFLCVKDKEQFIAKKIVLLASKIRKLLPFEIFK